VIGMPPGTLTVDGVTRFQPGMCPIPLVVPPDKPVQTPITSQVVRETDPIRSTQLGTVDTRRLGLNLVRPRYVAAGADLFGPIR
jgi:hypothetical protein